LCINTGNQAERGEFGENILAIGDKSYRMPVVRSGGTFPVQPFLDSGSFKKR
jgi:hypothetical protein